jgi:tricorn protease
VARRITRHEGGETFARFSPDGKSIAFTASYDGGSDVYVMDAAGGPPRRLTYHPAADYVQEWFPDGEWILFRSRGRNYPSRDYTLWKVHVDGGMPVRLPIDRGGLASVSPDGKRIAYNRIAREFATWKRYKGGMAMDIWLCTLEEGRFEKITDFVGNDNWPMWMDEGSIYYLSDASHTANLFKYSFQDQTRTQVTFHKEYDVKYPARGRLEDQNIVYQNGGELFILECETGESRKVSVRIPSDRVPVREHYFPVEDHLGSFGLSPTGVRMVFDSRGDLYTVPVKEGTPRCITPDTPGSREKNPAWSPDGRWVAFFSDRTGEEELYLVDRKGDVEWIQLTSDAKGFRMQPCWSPDSRYLAISDKHLKLNLVDVEARTKKVIDQGEVDTGWEDWGVQEYTFSPDSRWLAYTKVVKSQLESIFLYSIDKEEVFPLTDAWRNDFSPSFDPEGKYLYFLSDRTFNPIMGELDQNHIYLDMTRPYVFILKEGAPSPFKAKETDEEVQEAEEKEADGEENPAAPADGEEEVAEEATEASEADAADGTIEPEAAVPEAPAPDVPDAEEEKPQEEKEPLIDVGGFARRIVTVPVPAGNYFRLEAVKGGFIYLAKKEHEFLKYQIVTDGTASGYDLHKFDLKTKKPTPLCTNLGNYHLSADGKKMVYRAGGAFHVVASGAKVSAGAGKVDLARVFGRVDRKAEFLQMFDEAWRIQRDFFYDTNMHQVDWNAMGEKYRALVPFCGNRADLNYLIGEMIGELNAGHTYVYGGDRGFRTDQPRPSVGLMGVDFDVAAPGNYYRIAKILKGDNADPAARSPLFAPDCGVKGGDYLIAVDGAPVKRGDNVYAFFEGKLNHIVTITYNENPTPEEAKTFSFKPIASDMELRYRRWVEGCRTKVNAATEGQVAYLHLPDMGERGLVEFAKVYFAQHYKKGLIIDDRYNAGGFTADMILDRLERRLWSLTIPREGGILRNPENTFFGPKTLIINQDTGSCGEYFATAFRVKAMGKIVGMRTWGGAVGIEPHQDLADGGTVTPPQFAPYSPWTKEWYFEGWGVEPDVEVENMPADVLAGKDAQLEKAIEIVLGEIKEYYEDWDELPPPPDYPDKR